MVSVLVFGMGIGIGIAFRCRFWVLGIGATYIYIDGDRYVDV